MGMAPALPFSKADANRNRNCAVHATPVRIPRQAERGPVLAASSSSPLSA